jgi:ribosome biogenesis protein SSF1/2
VILLSCDPDTELISLRHFCISVTPSGLTKGVKALIQGHKLPDLSGFTDVADFIEKAGYASESEGEDAAASRVTMGQDVGRANFAQRTSRIKLHEVRRRRHADGPDDCSAGVDVVLFGALMRAAGCGVM